MKMKRIATYGLSFQKSERKGENDFCGCTTFGKSSVDSCTLKSSHRTSVHVSKHGGRI